MAYKDKEKQRAAGRQAQKRFRARQKGITSVIDKQGITYEIVEGITVYNRQAVKYNLHEAWDLRPEPLSSEDRPKPLNRCKYIRPDGSEYLFDACGEAHESTEPTVTSASPIHDAFDGNYQTPEGPKPEVPTNYGQPDCQCRHCKQTKTSREQGRLVLNHGPRVPANQLGANEVNRVSLPGDVDYAGVCNDRSVNRPDKVPGPTQDRRAQGNEV